MNIKFCYLYRDGGNYKNFNEIVFANPFGITLDKIEAIIINNLIDEKWFVSKEWNVPDMHFKGFAWDSEIDHEWHEFEMVEETFEESTEKRNIEDFLVVIRKNDPASRI